MNVTKGILLAALVVGLPSTAPSQSTAGCDATYRVFDYLRAEFGETSVVRARIDDGVDRLPAGARLTFLANNETRTWTIVVTYVQSGQSCMVAAGSVWTMEEEWLALLPGAF